MIIALDPSLANTAVVRGDLGRYEVKTFSSVRSGDSLGHRFERYQTQVAQIADWLGDVKPELILIEGYSYGSDFGREYLAEYGGLLRAALLRLTHRVREIQPHSLKLFASGTGGGKKEKVIKGLTDRYGVRFGTNDEYDAFALFRIGLMLLRKVGPEDEAQAQVLYQIEHAKELKAEKRAKRTKKRAAKAAKKKEPKLF